MTGALGVARTVKALIDERLALRLRELESEDPDLTPGMLSQPRLVTYTEPNWPIGIDQQPAVVITVRNAGTAQLDDSRTDYETWRVTYEVAAEIYLTAANPSVADIARYAWTEAIRRVWLSSRGEGTLSVLPGFAETYDTVVEDREAAAWVSRALSVVQVEVSELYPTRRVQRPADSVDVKAGYVGADQELDVPIHPALMDDDTPGTVTP